MQEVIYYLQSKLKKTDTLVVGVSGGPDSMCLLSILVELQSKIGYKIVVAHVNHMVREASIEEESYVKEYAFKNHLVFESIRLEKLTGNFEAEARQKRYEFFFELMDKYKGTYLMTAHHGDDVVETILMRLIRGSNLSGYKGITLESNRDGYTILRPLLFLNKEMILEYLEEKDLLFYYDETNGLDSHFRNRLRKHVLPVLKKENSSVHLKFLQFSDELDQVDKLLQKMTHNILNSLYNNGVYDVNLYKEQEVFMQKKVLEEILHQVYKEDLYLVTSGNIHEMDKALQSSSPSVEVNLPNGYVFYKSYGKFWIQKKNDSFYEGEILSKDLQVQGDYQIVSECSKSNYVLRIDLKEVKLPLMQRHVLPGDMMDVKNLGHSKKVARILIDQKIPKWKRESIPVVVDTNNQIIWIPGICKSSFDKDISKKCDIIIKYFDKGEKIHEEK